MEPYVALGDSYAAGVGAGVRVNDCFRSVLGYPVLVAEALGVDLSYQSCEGALIADVRRTQLAALSSSTQFVTVTAGGNDIGFTSVLTECAKPAWMSDSDAAIDGAVAVVRGALPALLAGLYGEIRADAPAAKFVVAGYPRLFDDDDCNLGTFFSNHEMDRLNAVADELATLMATVAESVGAEFVDVRGAFVGHAFCDNPEWIRGLSWPTDESYHPNTAGYAAYSRLVATALGAPEVPIDGRRRPPRVVEGPSSGLGRPTFQPPDLLCDASLAGARRYGIDPEEVQLLARRLGQGPPGDRAAQDRLRELDEHARSQR